jgi:hypothetical protein
VSKRYPTPKQFTGSSQSIAHVANDQEFCRRHAIWMSCNPTIADVDFPIREQLAQVVVGPTIAEPKLKHLPVQLLDQAGRHIEAGALGL